MTSILNNVAALGASRQLGVTAVGLQKTIQRLTTGQRINNASDDAAGLGISNQLGADIRIASQGRRNANDGVSYLQVADGVLNEVTNLLTRASELAQQAQTGTVSATNRSALDAEFQNIITSIADIGQSTKFNGTTVFSGSALTVAVAGFSSVIVSVSSFSSSASVALGLTAGTSSLTTAAGASAVAAILVTALTSVSSLRASIGAGEQQLASVSNSLGIQVENFTAAYSQIRDANIADEVVNLTKFQILNQSGTSALGQANQSSQNILALLR
jgi:flagellin